MLKNRFLAAFALSGLVAFTACEAEEEAPAVDAEVVTEEPVVAPVVPAPVVTDTLGGAVTDTAAGVVGADTAAGTTQP